MRPGLRQAFWHLARPYWVSEDRWRGRGLFAAIVALSLATVWVNVQLNAWNGDFYNALQERNFDDFQRLLLAFAGWAFLYIALVVYQLYLTQMLQMRWRRWMTDHFMVRWLSDDAHYRMSLAEGGADNPDQRIAEDIKLFVDDSLTLFFGLLSSVVSFGSFVGILWALSGPITVSGVTVPGYMVWVAIGYALVGSLVAHRIGRPLVGLNFQQQRFEADFRFSLARARENAEASRSTAARQTNSPASGSVSRRSFATGGASCCARSASPGSRRSTGRSPRSSRSWWRRRDTSRARCSWAA